MKKDEYIATVGQPETGWPQKQYSTIDPLESAMSEGSTLASAAEKVHSWWAIIGFWLAWGLPVLIGYPYFLYFIWNEFDSGTEPLGMFSLIIAALLAIPVGLLFLLPVFRVTLNKLKASKPSASPAASGH